MPPPILPLTCLSTIHDLPATPAKLQIAFHRKALATAAFRPPGRVDRVLATGDDGEDMLRVVMDSGLAVDARTNHSCEAVDAGIRGVEKGQRVVVDR